MATTTSPKPTTAPTAASIAAKIYVDAHKHASNHRVEIDASERCACFFCFRTFAPTSIKVWIDAKQTALCPACGVDSVLGSASPHRIDDGFLRKMHQHHFAYRSK